MQAGKALKTAAAFMLSVAMLATGAACGTSDVVKKGDQQMDEALQKALQKLIDDGTYMKILKYWGVQDGAISKPEINTPGTNE